MKTPEELALEYMDQDKVACAAIDHAAEHLNVTHWMPLPKPLEE